MPRGLGPRARGNMPHASDDAHGKHIKHSQVNRRLRAIRQGKHTARLRARRCGNILHSLMPLAARQRQHATRLRATPRLLHTRSVAHMSSSRTPRMTHTTRLRVTRRENIPPTTHFRATRQGKHAIRLRATRWGKAYHTSSGHVLGKHIVCCEPVRPRKKRHTRSGHVLGKHATRLRATCRGNGPHARKS